MTDQPNLYAPDGTPWCHFGRGLWCLNGDRCLNPNHRPPSGGNRPHTPQTLTPHRPPTPL